MNWKLAFLEWTKRRQVSVIPSANGGLMRHTVLVALASAAVAWLAVASTGGSGRASAQRATTLPEANAGLIALPTALPDGRQMLTLVDPRTRVISVYQIDVAKGEIALKGVRNIHWDLQIDEYNGVSPLPAEIRSLIEQK